MEKEETEEPKKEPIKQEDSNGFLLLKAILGFAAAGYAIYVLTKQ